MLRNVLIISDGGLVLFSKEFFNTVSQPRLVGSLLTAILEFSTNNVGAPVSYLEFSTIAVSICSSKGPEDAKLMLERPSTASSGSASPAPPHLSRHKSEFHNPVERHETPSATPKQTPRRSGGGSLICALFHDVEDGPELGRLIAVELLSSFRRQFGASLAKVGGGTPHINLNDFEPFHATIPVVLQGLVAPVLEGLMRVNGIKMSLLLSDDSRILHCTADGVDGLGLGANLEALSNLSEDAMGAYNDVFRSAVISGRGSTRLHIFRLPYAQATLVVQSCRSTRPRDFLKPVAETVRMCVKLFKLMDNLNLLTDM